MPVVIAENGDDRETEVAAGVRQPGCLSRAPAGGQVARQQDEVSPSAEGLERGTCLDLCALANVDIACSCDAHRTGCACIDIAGPLSEALHDSLLPADGASKRSPTGSSRSCRRRVKTASMRSRR